MNENRFSVFNHPGGGVYEIRTTENVSPGYTMFSYRHRLKEKNIFGLINVVRQFVSFTN